METYSVYLKQEVDFQSLVKAFPESDSSTVFELLSNLNVSKLTGTLDVLLKQRSRRGLKTITSIVDEIREHAIAVSNVMPDETFNQIIVNFEAIMVTMLTLRIIIIIITIILIILELWCNFST